MCFSLILSRMGSCAHIVQHKYVSAQISSSIIRFTAYWATHVSGKDYWLYRTPILWPVIFRLSKLVRSCLWYCLTLPNFLCVRDWDKTRSARLWNNNFKIMNTLASLGLIFFWIKVTRIYNLWHLCYRINSHFLQSHSAGSWTVVSMQKYKQSWFWEIKLMGGQQRVERLKHSYVFMNVHGSVVSVVL